MAGKVYLRNNHEKVCPLIPYILTTGSVERVNTSMFGEIYVIPMAMDSGYVIGVGREFKIAMPLGTAPIDRSENCSVLTKKVNELALGFAQKAANAF